MFVENTPKNSIYRIDFVILHWKERVPGEGRLPYITDEDVRRNFQKQPLLATIWGVAPANIIP